MRHALKFSVGAAALTALAFGPAAAQTAVKPVPIKAMKLTAAPSLDGDDAVWTGAPAVTVNAVKGVHFKDNQGNTTATVRALYAGDTLYMMITWEDPTRSVQRFPYQKQPDGTWKKLVDANDKGGDDNVYYEDKFAMIWNIGGSIFGFNEKFGCQAACHAGEPGKPYGNKYTSEEGEIGDIWHMKYVRGGFLGAVDDQYVDHTRYSQKTPEAGRKSDASGAPGGGYQDVKLVDGKPEFMSRDAKPANKGGTYWIRAEDRVPFDDSKFVAGDEVASIVVAPFTGDRGDIRANVTWQDGKWTAKLARKLVTGSKTDVQFNDLGASYGFGIAFFDNAQVRHAYVQEPLILTFEK